MAVQYSDQLRYDGAGYAKLASGDRLVIRGKCANKIEIPHSAGGNMVTLEPGASGWAQIVGHNYGQDACRVGPGYTGPGFEFRDSLFAVHDRVPADTHQDGVQTGGGLKVKWVRCLWVTYVDSTQGLFFQGFSGGKPTDCVAEDCVIAGTWVSVIVAGDGSTGCGARRTLCQNGKSYNYRKKVTNCVDEGNKFVNASDAVLAECVRTLSVAPWTGGKPTPQPPPPEPPPAQPPVPPLPTEPSHDEKVDRMWSEMLDHGWAP